MRIVFLLLLIAGFAPCFAKADDENLFEKPLEQVLDIQVSVASGSPTSIRSAPGIVTVLTRDEIRNSGARDLIDLLNLLPGVHFFADVEGTVGIGLRGHADGILILWNGHEMTELLYNTNQFGYHFPIDQIERIEMIRGPGSVLYGGLGEFGVVNISTIPASNLEGALVTATGGASGNEVTRYGGNVAVAKTYDDVRISSSIFKGRGVRGNGKYTDSYGSTFDLSDNELKPQLYSFDVAKGKTQISFLGDDYHTYQRDESLDILPYAAEIDFSRYSLIGKTSVEPFSNFTVTPLVSYRYQKPFESSRVPPYEGYEYHQSLTRYQASLTGQYNPGGAWSGIVGGEYHRDESSDYGTGTDADIGGAFTLSSTDVFAEVEHRSDIANIRIGARYDKPREFDGALVPRLTVTREFDRFHIKGLATGGFYSPSTENFHTSEEARDMGIIDDTIQPERSRVYEIEAGYRFPDNIQFTTSLFSATPLDAISYNYEPEREFVYYSNSSTDLGTHGLETGLSQHGDWGYVNLSYSFYESDVPGFTDLEVPGHESYRTGFARHKGAGYASIVLTDHLRLNPSFILVGPRYAITKIEEDEKHVYSRLDTQFLANVHLRYQVPGFTGLELDAGVNDLFGERFEIGEAGGDFGHAPISQVGPEFLLTVRYQM